MPPFVSVIVPVFNDAERLEKCLRSLERQTYPERLYEVIVVDNGSDGDLEPLVARFSQARLSHESRPSQFAARNRGVGLSRGEVIAFIDSDCIPALSWIEKGVMHLERFPNCGLVAGRIQIFFWNPERPTAVELYDRATNLIQKTYVELGRFGATANLFTRSEVFERVGPFDDVVRSGGDVEWGQRVSSYGYDLIYAADASVSHPARRSLGELLRMVARRIGGVHDMQRRRACSFLGIDRGFIRGLLPPIRYSVTVLSDPTLVKTTDKLKVVALVFLVRYVEQWEWLRLKLGGKSRR